MEEPSDSEEHGIFKKKKKNSNELDSYLDSDTVEEDTDVILWWSSHIDLYPVLSKLALDRLIVTATSVPSERAFSKAGDLVSLKRNLLSDSLIESLMLLNSWLN